MTEKVKSHTYNLDKQLEEVNSWKIKLEEKKQVLQFFKDYRNGKVTGRIGTNPTATLSRYVYYIRTALENTSKLDKKGIEDFKDRILQDKIKNYSGEPYAIRSKTDVFKMFSRYLTWKLKDKSFELVKILDIKISRKKKDVECFTQEEDDKIYSSCKTNLQRYRTQVLRWGGMRIEEYSNIRYSDITFPKGKELYVKIYLRNEFSKTEGREITLFGKNCLKTVKEFLAERINQSIKPEEQVDAGGYGTIQKWLKEFGDRIKVPNCHPHKFRSTCATYLADKLNRQQLCIWFGWSFSSPMPDVYIKRKNVNMLDVEGKFKVIEYEEQEKKIEELAKRLIDIEKQLTQQAQEQTIEVIRNAAASWNKKGEEKIKIALRNRK